MKYLGIKIGGKPVAWKRAGWSDNVFYDKQRHEKMIYQVNVESKIFETEKFGSVPLGLDVRFYLPRLDNAKRRKKIWPVGYPDLDNLLKFLLDALSKNHLFPDDRFFAQINMQKIYSNIPRTVFTIRELHDPDLTPEEIKKFDIDNIEGLL